MLESSHLTDPAGAARREYAALLANACATQLRLPTAAPVFLRLNEGIACPGLTATYVGQLLETAVVRVEGEYVDLNPAHRPALGPVNWGDSGFAGGVDAMYYFLGAGPEPFAHAEAFPGGAIICALSCWRLVSPRGRSPGARSTRVGLAKVEPIWRRSSPAR